MNTGLKISFTKQADYSSIAGFSALKAIQWKVIYSMVSVIYPMNN